MPNGRKLVRVVRFLLAGVTIFCVSWIASVGEWHSGIRWTSRREVGESVPTMRTIVAYSEGKQAEMDRPMPVTCDRLPVFPAIPYINRTWSPKPAQSSWQQVAGTRVKLYAAYYDDRTPQRYIRILASFHGRDISTEVTLYCQTRSQNPYEDSVEVVAAKPLEMWWREWDVTASEVDTPMLLSCPLTESLYQSSIVSVVTQPCDDPMNAFQLELKSNEIKRAFTICVKDLNFKNNIRSSLIEWIETNKILEVDLIDIYVDEITNETEDVLLYYSEKGYVRLFHVPTKYSSQRSLWQRRRDHIITYNDCLYRNIQESEYIVPLDIDEIILPKIADSWPKLLDRLNENGWKTSQKASIMIQNVFFFDFMQDKHKYKHRNKRNIQNKMYTKRDDVRINNVGIENLEIGSIELIETNFNNEVIEDNVSNNVLYDKYKLRCGTELSIPKIATNIVSSAVISPVGYYSKSWMLTKKVLTAFNHYPLTSLGASGIVGWPAPFEEVQLNHYKESCNTTVMAECERYGRRARIDIAALKLRPKLTRALAQTICAGIKT